MILSRRAHDEIVAHAREAAPAECCGLLIGAGESIVEAVRATNLESNPNRFEIDPGDHIRARRAARSHALDVLGFYHSHPRSPATPSASDVAEASYPDHVHVIVSVRAEPADLRMYRIQPDGFRELTWVVRELS